MKISQDSEIMIVLGKHNYILNVSSQRMFHTHMGIIDLSQLVGREFGEFFSTSSGQMFTVLRPAVKDFVTKISRTTQVIYPKDAGAILMWANVFQGARVLESGTGSGALTCVLANAVGDAGRVYGFDVKESSLSQTEKNLKRLGLSSRVELGQRDIRDGVDLVNLDSAILDLPSPWEAVGPVKRALSADGHLLSFSPTLNQAEKTAETLRDSGFIRVEGFELIQRFYDLKPEASRPKTMGIWHTGFIVCGRNTSSKQRVEVSRIKPVRSASESESSSGFFEGLEPADVED
ncbi:MAG: tRNA (adenine-N1)-methyltransferase [Thermoprotei archaeon]